MILINFVVCVLAVSSQNAVAEPPNFRILAPPFVCPKDKDSAIEKMDNTVITVQTESGIELEYHWTVRWFPLVAPTQQFTLALWRTVRMLEQDLNEQLMEPNVFVINNTELLTGVNYIFNVTATYPGEDEGSEKVFYIDNIKGDSTLTVEGRSDMFSVDVVGGQKTYADMDYALEAQVTTCYRTQDYYFVWTVTSSGGNVAVWDVKGSRLEIRANTLTPGLSYDVLCQVYKYSNGDFITQNILPFRVLHRDISTHFNIDVLQVSINTPFSLYTDLTKLDYLEEGSTIAWECTLDGLSVDTYYKTDDEGTLIFPTGLPDVGEYLISLTVNVQGQSTADQAIARVITVETPLPLIQVLQNSRVLNEGSVTTLKANVTNMVPGCSVTWYFESEQCLKSEFSTSTENCHVTEHGTPISTPINFYSLEENFLSELTDYTNETSRRTVSGDLLAGTGRARVVAECGCLEDHNCTSEGLVYADIYFRINAKPQARYVMVTPHTATAMETEFRLSTAAVLGSNGPMRYTFYCKLSKNDSLVLGSYIDHLSFETLLPYIDGNTLVYVEVCDSLGACHHGAQTIVSVTPGEARTVDTLLEDARAHVKRCELMRLRRLAASAIVTYTVLQNSRVLNEGSVTTLKANVTNMVPGCSVTWYFESEQCLKSEFSTSTENCHVTEHGTPISTPINFYSLEENFLSELTDYTNETSRRTVSGDLLAGTGRARVVAECGCLEDHNCTSEGLVYADIYFRINAKPQARYVMVTPHTATAMETEFRLSTAAVLGSNGPMRYTFYCKLSKNDSLVLGSYIDHLSFETLLPYIDGNTLVYVEVCDSLGACHHGAQTIVSVTPGEARTVDTLLEDARAHVKRCELMRLRRLAASAIVTYTNAGQTDALRKFTSNLLSTMSGIEEHCIEKNYDQYYDFLSWLQSAGIDTTMLV